MFFLYLGSLLIWWDCPSWDHILYLHAQFLSVKVRNNQISSVNNLTMNTDDLVEFHQGEEWEQHMQKTVRKLLPMNLMLTVTLTFSFIVLLVFTQVSYWCAPVTASQPERPFSSWKEICSFVNKVTLTRVQHLSEFFGGAVWWISFWRYCSNISCNK